MKKTVIVLASYLIVTLPLRGPNLRSHKRMGECFRKNLKVFQKKEKKKKERKKEKKRKRREELHRFQFKWLGKDQLIKIKPGLKWKGKIL